MEKQGPSARIGDGAAGGVAGWTEAGASEAGAHPRAAQSTTALIARRGITLRLEHGTRGAIQRLWVRGAALGSAARDIVRDERHVIGLDVGAGAEGDGV